MPHHLHSAEAQRKRDRFIPDGYYALSGTELRALTTICLHLFGDAALSPDDRRDYANRMDLMLAEAAQRDVGPA